MSRRVGVLGQHPRSAFWRRRAATRRGLLAAVGAIVFVTTVALSVMVGTSAREPTAAARAGFQAASSSEGSMVWERTARRDAAAQDAETRTELRHVFGAAPVAIETSVVGEVLPVAGGSRTVLPLLGDAALRSRTSGLGTLQVGQASIDAVGARALSLSIGDRVTLKTDAGSRSLRIVSIWSPTDSRAPAWNGIGAGTQGTQGRLVLAPGELEADGIGLVARWSVAPTAAVTAAQLPILAAGYRTLAAQASSSTEFVRFEGGGAATLEGMRDGIAAAAAIVPVPLAILGAAGLIAMILLLNLLGELRAAETALLRARGGAVRQVAGGDLRAAIVPVGLGGLAGGLLAQAVLLTIGPPTGAVEVVMPALVPMVVALATVLVCSLLAIQSDPAIRTAGARRGAVVAAVVLLLLAAVGVQRLSTGGAGSDLGAELAPALLLAALVVMGLLLGGPLTAVADRRARAREGIPSLLAFRRLRFRPGMVTGAIVLVALAVAASGFAASTSATSAGFLRDAGRVTTGGDLAVSSPGDPDVAAGSSTPDPAALARTAGATAALPAFVETVQLSDLDATLAAAPVHRLSEVQDAGLAELSTLAGTAPPSTTSATASSTAPSAPGISLPGGGPLRVGVRLGGTTVPPGSDLELTAWLAAPDVPIVRIDLGSSPIRETPTDSELVSRLPGGGPWRLVALDASVQSPGEIDGLQVSVRSVATGDAAASRSAPLPASPWRLESAIPHPDGVGAAGTIGWTAPRLLDGDGDGDGDAGGHAELGRQMPGGSAVVPVVLSRALAESTGLGVGDRAVLDATPNISVRVTGIVAHTIGTASPLGVWADLPTLQLALLRGSPDLPRADRVWLASVDPAAAAARISAADPVADVHASPAAILARFSIPATVALLGGAVGAILFALIGIAAATAGLLRSRRDEILVLRALGADQRVQQGALRSELLGALGYAVVVGAVAAVVTVVVTVPALAHAADPGAGVALQAMVRADVFVLFAAVVVLAAATAVAVMVVSRAVSRSAERADDRTVERGDER